KKKKWEPPLPTHVGKKKKEALTQRLNYLPFVQNQERLKPQEEKAQEEKTRVEYLSGSPMGIKESVELLLTHPELYERCYPIRVPEQINSTFLSTRIDPKLVRKLFRVAEEHAPSIVFIDEIDAIRTKRNDSNSGSEREIQRTMLELLNQLDGGEREIQRTIGHHGNKSYLIIRSCSDSPGTRMTLSDDVDLEEFVMSKDDLSGTDIK
ncbi:10553_t:CDS:2, partial [Cetraspora pellucida]